MRKSIESIASVAEFKQDLKELSPESVRQIPLAARSWLRNNSHLEDKKWKIGSASLSHDSKLSPVVAADPIGHLQNPAADVGVDPQNAQTSSTQGALAMHIGTDALHNHGLNVPNNGENAPNIMEVEVISNPVPKSDYCGMSVSPLNTGGALELLDKDVEERLRTNVQETTMVMGPDPPPVTEETLTWSKLQDFEGKRIEVRIRAALDRWESVTVAYARNDSHCIAVMDDFSLVTIEADCQVKTGADNVSHPMEKCLVVVALMSARQYEKFDSMARRYLAGNRRKLEALACASKAFANRFPKLKYQRVLGSGGYGSVFLVNQSEENNPEVLSAAVKMEMNPGYSHYTEESLWREVNICSNSPRNIAEHFPKTLNWFGSHNYCRVYDGFYTASFFCMELLLPLAVEIFHRNSMLEGGIIPDKYRLTARDQCWALQKMDEGKFSHGDMKNVHCMHRFTGEESEVVFVDLGLGQSSQYTYDKNCPATNCSPPAVGVILFVPSCMPQKPGATYAVSKPYLKLIGSDRPGTPDYRPQNEAHGHEERHKADMWGLAVGWLAGVGCKPIGGNFSAFEESLYKAGHSFPALVALIPGYDASSTDGGFHASVISWLRIIFRILSGACNSAKDLMCSSVLNDPFYIPNTLERLRTTGIIVPGVEREGRRQEVKPLLMLHVEGMGLILLTLLYYQPKEVMALYGGKEVKRGGLSNLSLHILPLGGDDLLDGSVSKFCSLEDYIKNSAVGSFLKSSNNDPSIDHPGTLVKPHRFKGDRKYCQMFTVKITTREMHGPGMQPTWPYNWSAGSHEPLMSEDKVAELQRSVSQILSDDVWRAISKARIETLRNGQFTDALLSTEIKSSLMPSEAPAWFRHEVLPNDGELPLVSAEVQTDLTRDVQCDCDSDQGLPEQGSGKSSGIVTRAFQCCSDEAIPEVVIPLPKELVSRIETALLANGINSPEVDWSDARENAEILDTSEQLKSHGLPFFEEIPKQRTAAFSKVFDEQGQGIAFLDTTSVALESAKRIRETEQGNELYERVCRPEIQGELNQEKCGNAEQHRRYLTRTPPEKCTDSLPKPTMAAWIFLVTCYLSTVPARLWKTIFQTFIGTADERSGDIRRSEMKRDKWARPEMMDQESRDSFLDKLAGYYLLLYFYEALFTAVVNILPQHANISVSLALNMASVLSAEREHTGDTIAGASAQDPHNDKKPCHNMQFFSVIVNLSPIFCYLGIMVNSCPNFKNMMQYEEDEFEQFEQRFLVTMSASDPSVPLADAMGAGTLKEKVYFAWQHFFQEERPETFKQMYSVYGRMQPLVAAVFDTDVMHWGAPYPMPGVQYPQDFPMIHYR